MTEKVMGSLYWQRLAESFSEAEFEFASYNVSISWEEEGYGGYFDPQDENDRPLLRFYIYEADAEEGDDAIEHGSYCTQLDVSTPAHLLEVFAGLLADAAPYKRRIEELTWITREELEQAYDKRQHEDS